MRPSQDTREPGMCGWVNATGQQTLKKKNSCNSQEAKTARHYKIPTMLSNTQQFLWKEERG